MYCCMHAHELHKHFSIQQWGMLQLILSLHTQIYISPQLGSSFTYVSELINDHSETNVLHLGVLHTKHVVLQVLQCVLNRKACYTPFMPMCITSKSMLYA